MLVTLFLNLILHMFVVTRAIIIRKKPELLQNKGLNAAFAINLIVCAIVLLLLSYLLGFHLLLKLNGGMSTFEFIRQR